MPAKKGGSGGDLTWKLSPAEKTKRLWNWVCKLTLKKSIGNSTSSMLATLAEMELHFRVEPVKLCKMLRKAGVKFKPSLDDPPITPPYGRKNFLLNSLTVKVEELEKRVIRLEKKKTAKHP